MRSSKNLNTLINIRGVRKKESGRPTVHAIDELLNLIFYHLRNQTRHSILP